MAFTVTARQSGTNGTTAATNLASSSATPTASSLFVVAYGAEMDAFGTVNLPDMSAPSGGSLTYTLIDRDGETNAYLWGSSNGFWLGGGCWRATIGGAPSAFAVTVDGDATANAYHSVVCFDVTGHNTSTPIVQNAHNGARINPESSTASGTVTLGATPTAGNLIVVVFFAGADGGGPVTSPTAGAGKTFTALGNNQNTASTITNAFYRVADGAESTTISCSDLGQTVGNYVAVAFEVAAASSGTSHTQTPTDNLGLTDSASVDKVKSPVDNLGLTDASAALDFGASVSNPLGLTDSALVEKSLAQSPADSEGLTDSAEVGEGKNPTDTLGLTDATVLDRSLTLSDSLGLTDSAQVTASGAGSVNPTDNLGLTDSVAANQGHAYTDSEGLTDTAALTIGGAYADSLGLTEAAALEFGKGQSDALGLTDSASIFTSGSVTATDNLGLTDATVTDRGQVFGDSAGLTDSVTLLLDAVKQIIDSAALTDTADVVLILPATSGTAHGAVGSVPTASAGSMTVPTATGG